MSHVISLVNAFAASWADAVSRACWQGGLGIALVWLLCRLWPAMPADPRCWLWRLAYLKLLLGLVWLPPLALPLLPAPKPTAPPPLVQVVIPPASVLPNAIPLPAVGPAVSYAAPLSPPAALSPPPAAAPLPAPRPTLPTPQTWLLAAWLLGALASLGCVASAWRRACALSRASRPLADEALQVEAADLCRRLGLRRVPPLRVADGLASPLLLGLGRPAVLLPALVGSGSPHPELRLMLAHELAHLVRRDLWWNVLPQTAQRLFFFHPLVWLAGHEWALAQEIACDALAVQTTGTPPSAYGRMLLGIATRRRTSAASLFPTLAVAAPRHTLRRRLHAMQHIGTASRPRLMLAAALTALLAVGGLLPWRVVAQSGASAPPAMHAEEARQDKECADFAAWEAQSDAQFAEVVGQLPPARQKEAQARIAGMDVYVAKSQKHTLIMGQHRADYIATHPYRLSNAQRNDITRLLDLNIRRNDLNQSVAMGRILRVKLLADVAATDTASRKSYRAQIERADNRRRAAEQEMRLLEPRIARQKAAVALIPQDQRDLMSKLREYDIDIWGGRIEALTIKRSRVQVVRQLLATKPPRQRQGATIKAPFATPEADTAPSNAIAIGGPPPLRPAQSETSLSTSPIASQSEATREKDIQKERADIDGKNALLDAQIAEIQKNVSPAQWKKVQLGIASMNATDAEEQKRVYLLEQGRAEYATAHPNQLSDEQIAFVRHFDWFQWKPTRIRANIRREQITKRKLQASLASARDARSRRDAQQQIVAIDQRRQQGEEQIRDWQPIIDRDRERIALLPAGQSDRVTKLDRYDLNITVNKLVALQEKQWWTQSLRRRLADKLSVEQQTTNKAEVVPLDASAALIRTPQLSLFSRHGTLRVRIFAQDATGRYLVLDKCSYGKNLIVPSVTAKKGVKINLLVYNNERVRNSWWF